MLPAWFRRLGSGVDDYRPQPPETRTGHEPQVLRRRAKAVDDYAHDERNEHQHSESHGAPTFTLGFAARPRNTSITARRPPEPR
jgi:hypothetical protein